MMPIDAKQVVLCLLLAGTAIVCSATETGSQSNNFVVKSDEPKANETRVCDTRPCSKLEYYDKLKQKCRDFPGGGILVIMDHSTKCAHGDSGLHTFSRRDYYYVCHPEGVMIGLCPESTVFSNTEKRCIMQTSNQPSTIKVHDESRNCNIVVPDCNGVGLFPIPSNCSFYFKCQEHNYDFYQYIYQCPPGKVFHPDLLRCSSSNKCYDGHEDILNNFNKDYFSECHILGLFRTAKDCTLYYRCVPNMDGSFYQIRYECPYKMYYNIEKEICEPELYRNCDYIPHERIIEDYKIKHSLEGSTLAAYPTTVISAINTQITSTMPTYYDTTRPMDVTGTSSLVQELAEKLITTEQVLDSTMKIPDDPVSRPETFPGNKNEISNDEYDETTDINGRNTSLEDLPYTNMAAMSQKSYATEESVIYHDEFDRENKITDESVARAEPLDIRDYESQPIENVEASTSPDGNNFLLATEVAPEQPEDGLTAKTRPGYDEMEWDSGAWKLPNRSKSKDSPGTESVTESTTTEWPDHYSADLSPSNPYSTLKGQAECESLSQITEYDGITSSYSTVEPYRQQISTNSEGFKEHINEFTDSINSTISTMREHRGSLDLDQNTVEAAEPSNAFNINCNADEDGEIVCNGQKLSVNGYLEILGYRLKLTKWKDAPAESWNEPGPTINIHLSLQHPFNYLFEAIATEYRTSFSYDYALTTTPNSTIDNFYEEDTETDWYPKK